MTHATIFSASSIAHKRDGYGFDSKNNLTSVTNALNQTVTRTYDANSLLNRRTFPRGDTDYTYTNGLPRQSRMPTG